MTRLDDLLAQMRLDGEFVSNVTSWRVLEARPARYAEYPPTLHPRLKKWLARQGVESLYRHQAQAVQHVLDGRNVVVVTPTASGKTLCYNLPVLDTLLNEPAARALYIFPTKALAHDQLDNIQTALDDLELSAAAASYDGDTPQYERPRIRKAARILLTNPDMLHVGILPFHAQWHEFFTGLRYVVIDELHTYRGVFGSHVANVLRRLKRICRFYGTSPQFICTSATIANPLELAGRLTEVPFTLVAENGAPQGERHVVFYNPPIIDRKLGVRRPFLLDTRNVAERFLAHDVQTVVFARSRRAVEQLVIYLRQKALHIGRDAHAVRGYRAGYLPRERRQIEARLRDGTVRTVAATNALELGIDIGGLDACIMAGYPGTIASTWQQAGRAGRGLKTHVAILVASSSPLDQYIITHPDYFFGQSPEHALVHPDNLYLLLDHVHCATFELPFTADERYGAEDVQELLRFLEEEGAVRFSGARWHWIGDDMPARAVSLRSADPTSVTIVTWEDDAQDRRRLIGQIDRAGAPLWVHEGAVYMHEGRQYHVESLDWEAGMAEVRPIQVDYYTEPISSTRIDIERVYEEKTRAGIGVAHGEVRITSRVTGYKRLRLGTMEHLGWGDVDLPEQQTVSGACWLTVSDDIVERLRKEGWWVGEHVESRGPNWPQQRDRARQRDRYRCRRCGAQERPRRQHHVHHVVPFRDFGWVPGQNENYIRANKLDNLITLCPVCHRLVEQQVAVQSTLSRLGRVLGHLAPLFLMCDSRDIGISSDVKAPQTGLPTLFVFDRIPAGVGVGAAIYTLYGDLLDKAAELIHDCPCSAGCPSCVGPADGDEHAKQQVLRLIEAMRPS